MSRTPGRLSHDESDIGRFSFIFRFDVFGWFAPMIIRVKILLQRLWEQRVDWDNAVPGSIYDECLKWCSQLNLLPKKHIPRCYFNKDTQVASLQLHGFSDA